MRVRGRLRPFPGRAVRRRSLGPPRSGAGVPGDRDGRPGRSHQTCLPVRLGSLAGRPPSVMLCASGRSPSSDGRAAAGGWSRKAGVLSDRAPLSEGGSWQAVAPGGLSRSSGRVVGRNVPPFSRIGALRLRRRRGAPLLRGAHAGDGDIGPHPTPYYLAQPIRSTQRDFAENPPSYPNI